MCLKLIELTRPELLVTPRFALPVTSRVAPDFRLSVEARGLGCMNFDARLLLVPLSAFASDVTDCAFTPRSWGGSTAGRREMMAKAVVVRGGEMKGAACSGLSICHRAPSPAKVFNGVLPDGLTGSYCVVLAAEFDQAWGHQKHPDPKLGPQALATRVRIDEHYTAQASDGDMRIDDYRTKLFPVLPVPLQVGLATPAAPGASGGVPSPSPTPATAAASASAPGAAGGSQKTSAAPKRGPHWESTPAPSPAQAPSVAAGSASQTPARTTTAPSLRSSRASTQVPANSSLSSKPSDGRLLWRRYGWGGGAIGVFMCLCACGVFICCRSTSAGGNDKRDVPAQRVGKGASEAERKAVRRSDQPLE